MIFNKRGAIFFTIDTLIAGLIILVTIILALSIHSSKPVVEDMYHELNRLVSFLSSNTMRDVRDRYSFAYVYSSDEDLELTIYEMVYKLYLEQGVDSARALVANMSSIVVPSHVGVVYSVGDVVIYSTNQERFSFARSSITNRLLTYYVNSSSEDFDVLLTTTNITVWV